MLGTHTKNAGARPVPLSVMGMCVVAMLGAILYLEADAGEDAVSEETKTTVTGESDMQHLVVAPLVVKKNAAAANVKSAAVPEGVELEDGWKTVEEQEMAVMGETSGGEQEVEPKEEEIEEVEQQKKGEKKEAPTEAPTAAAPANVLEPLMDNSVWTKACAAAPEWGTQKCGGWGQGDVRAGDVPASYKKSVDMFRQPFESKSPRIPMEDVLQNRKEKGGIFCYGMVMNPPGGQSEFAYIHLHT